MNGSCNFHWLVLVFTSHVLLEKNMLIKGKNPNVLSKDNVPMYFCFTMWAFFYYMVPNQCPFKIIVISGELRIMSSCF